MDAHEAVDIVRRGYDDVSCFYRGDDDQPDDYLRWLDTLQQRLPAAATVLDLGCGCGVPMAKGLAERGHHVTGVDISEVQISRARRLVPTATFLHADACLVTFPETVFDAVVCLYAFIHMPVNAQRRLMARIATWLRPGGWLLATTGVQAWTGTEVNWLGSNATMWWSHTDAATFRTWITRSGLRIDSEEFVPEGTSGHQLFWARRAH